MAITLQVQSTVVAKNVCATSTSATRSVFAAQGRPGTPNITGPANPCAGQAGAIYTATATGGDTYTWTVPGGYTINSGQGTNTINVTPGTTGVAANITVSAINGCGTSQNSGSRSVTPAFTPAQPGTITGTTSFCPGHSYTYSISAVTGATTYTWTVPTGWVITGGQGTTSLTATTNQNGGTVSVTPATSTCAGSSRTTTVTPLTTSDAGNSRTVCGSSATLDGNAVIQGSGVWTVVSGTGIFTSASQATTTVNNMAFGSNVYRWTCSNGGCAVSTTVTITRDCQASYTAAPAKPAFSNYSTGENLASVIDPDGNITSATIISGTLPPGIGFNSTTGKFTVINPSTLQSGSWTYSVRTVDQYGGVSNPQVTIAMINPLPVEFASFSGKMLGRQVQLTWTTATELNNNYFNVEKSADGVNFASFAKEQGAGNSYDLREYNMTDEDPYSKVTYYRIRQTDFNGEYSYSKTIRIVTGEVAQAEGIVKVYPNPSTGADVNIKMENMPQGVALMNIVDMKGQTVVSKYVNLAGGSYQMNVRNETGMSLMPGLYSIMINAGNTLYDAKFIIQ